jgi:hypothetical protein
MFISLWSTEAHDLDMTVEDGRADGDVTVKTRIGAQMERWHLPWAAEEVTHEQLADSLEHIEQT